MSARRSRPGVELVLIPPACKDEGEIVGVEAVPGRLPYTPRLPGEPVSSLIQRALHAVGGRGAVLAHFRLQPLHPQDAVTRLA